MTATKPFSLGVKALVADEQDRVLLIRRAAKSKFFAHCWDLPGGKLDRGETFDVAVAREVVEETGLTIRLEGVAGATEYEMLAVRAVALFLEARRVGGDVRLSSEHDDFDWVPRIEIANRDVAANLKSFFDTYVARLLRKQ